MDGICLVCGFGGSVCFTLHLAENSLLEQHLIQSIFNVGIRILLLQIRH